jgi:hypothetical protein
MLQIVIDSNCFNRSATNTKIPEAEQNGEIKTSSEPPTKKVI